MGESEGKHPSTQITRPGMKEEEEEEERLQSGTEAMEKVWTRESEAVSHCPQHTIVTSPLQLHSFLCSSDLTYTHTHTHADTHDTHTQTSKL